MYYIYRSPTLNNIVHVTRDKDLYSESYYIGVCGTKDEVNAYNVLAGKEICWCDENPIPHSLS